MKSGVINLFNSFRSRQTLRDLRSFLTMRTKGQSYLDELGLTMPWSSRSVMHLLACSSLNFLDGQTGGLSGT